MKILIIPDVHGRDFWIEPCYNIDKFDKVIFLGDYHDPYPFQVSEDTSRRRLRDKLLPFVLEHKDKVICLLGNHDGNYLIGEMADRMDVFHKENIANYLNQMDLKLAYQEGKYLFTHSGVLLDWLEYNNITLEDVLADKVFSDALIQVSPNRDGCDPCGSCIWGDVSEYAFSRKIPGIFQIFGHTQIEKEIITDEFACLDCRKAFVLDTELETLKSYEEWLNNQI
jgi:predicted phosphodiesterase